MPTSRVEFLEDANSEYDEAFDWYLQRSPDTALKFDAEVNRALLQVIHDPRRWAAGPQGTHKFLLRHFPFILVYREVAFKAIQIVAVAHTSRKPDYWKERF